MDEIDFIAVNVGNTRTQVARITGRTIEKIDRYMCDEIPAMVRAIIEGVKEFSGSPPVVFASVNDAVAGRIESGVSDQMNVDTYRVGVDLPIPIGTQLDPETMTGVDRLLNAAAAYATLQQACVIVDVGTAITVDFVDGKGTFHGGAIAPGAAMQLAALHERTDALPEVQFAEPAETFGRSTSQAMLQGVFFGIRGLVWKLTERYAETYEAYPVVVATGGDAEVVFQNDDLIDRMVPDLTLSGIAETVATVLATDEESGAARLKPMTDDPGLSSL